MEKQQMLGHTLFKSRFFSDVLPNLEVVYEEDLRKDVWTMTLNEEWISIFNEIIQTKLPCFILIGNLFDQPIKVPNIFKAIAHIKFDRLKEVSLTGNKINNIESLTFLDAPNLHTLRVIQNLITSLKPINKVNWKKVKYINFQGNYIKEFDINRAQTSIELDHLVCEFWTREIQVENPIKLMKLRTKGVNFLILSEKMKPITNKKIKYQLKKRFSSCVVDWGDRSYEPQPQEIEAQTDLFDEEEEEEQNHPQTEANPVNSDTEKSQ